MFDVLVPGLNDRARTLLQGEERTEWCGEERASKLYRHYLTDRRQLSEFVQSRREQPAIGVLTFVALQDEHHVPVADSLWTDEEMCRSYIPGDWA